MRNWLWLALAIGTALPWMILRLLGIHPEPPVMALLAGVAILGAGFLLSWAVEVAQMDMPQALALAVLSLVAVLPEYSVDAYFAWRAGQDIAYIHYPIANMTGANRLLIGLGWPVIVFLFWWRTREKAFHLDQGQSLELRVLALATLYGFVIVYKGSLSIADAALLIGLYAAYAWATSRHPSVEPDLVGPALSIGTLRTGARRLVTFGMFAYAAAAILLSAEPFAEGLVQTGRVFGVDEFILVQWLAPLASESPEFLVAALFVFRGHVNLAIRAMTSSKVNQWTLLVGMLPLVYAASVGQPVPLVFDERQNHEILLTVAQSAFAVTLLADLRFSVLDGLLLAVLFGVQLLLPDTRLYVSFVYLGLTAALLIADGSRRRALLEAPRRLFRLSRSEQEATRLP